MHTFRNKLVYRRVVNKIELGTANGGMVFDHSIYGIIFSGVQLR